MDGYVTTCNVNKNKKDNNKGSTLLLVIVAMSFVAIISAVILVITYRNLESIRNGLSGTDNFYTAETAMDELKMTFNEMSDKAVRSSYTRWLQRVSGTAKDDQEALFKQLFVAEMRKVLKNDFTDKYFGGAASGDIDDLFDTFTSDVRWNDAAGDPRIVTSDTFDPHTTDINDDTKLTLENVSVIYKDSGGFSTTITTDYVFEVEYPGLSVKNVTVTNSVCSDYVVIADGQVANVANSNVKVNGSMYGGGYNPASTAIDKYDLPGIRLQGGQTTIYGDNIVSKSELEVTDGAKLVIKGLDAAEDYTGELHYADIWAKGLNITGNGPAGMNIQGNCYITDDATLNAVNSGNLGKSYLNVSGSYYGYNTSNSAIGDKDENDVALIYGTPEGSSSVVINSSNSSADFTDCDPLWLAGKSFVSIPDQYGYVDSNNVSIPAGESLSYRGLQSAYLLPGDCIMGVGHNPMTEEEYKKLVKDSNKPSLEDGDYFIDLTRSVSNGGVRLINYLNLSQPYRVAFVTYSATNKDKLVYLYLNFTNTDKAAEYFQEYEGKYEELVNDRMGSLGNGSIKFNPSTIVSTGNCIGYDKGDLELYKANKDYNDSDVENKQTELATKYYGMISALDPDFSGINNTSFLTDSIVDMTKVEDAYKDLDLGTLEGVYEDYHLITGKDINITSNINAIVIATGDVNVASGTNFKGLIIARGNVTVNGNFDADPDAVGYLILYHNDVLPYFKLSTGEEFGTGVVDSTKLINISYANWKKN